MISLRFWRTTSVIPKRTLGPFELVRELGRGTMGVVYLAWDPVGRRRVAIKTLALAKEFNAAALEDAKSRFLREAGILASLNHPGIVKIYRFGEEQGVLYLAMEFLKGNPLAEYVTPGNLLPLRTTLDVIARAADALAYAHEQNVVHRDVKPANIMYDAAGGTVKVTDFGIAWLNTFSESRPRLVLGSPLYMSPEQVMCRPLNGLSDVFSLGSTLYQLVCGSPPFHGDSDVEVMRRIAEEPPDDILAIKPELPACVCAILNKALAKKVKDRYASGYEMAQALRACAANL